MQYLKRMKTKTLRAAAEPITETIDLGKTVAGPRKAVRADPLDSLCTGRVIPGIIGSFEP